MRIRLLPVVLALGACGYLTGPTTTTTSTTQPPPLLGAPSPEEAVRAWLTGLADEDYQSTMQVIPDDQLALLAASEARSMEQALSMLEGGVPSAVRHNFWHSFSEGLPGFSGEEIGDLVLGEVEAFSVEDRAFAAVSLVFRERVGSTEIITVADGDGRWWVDLFATFGSAFARPFRSWLEEVPPTGDGADVRRAMSAHRASLAAGLERMPLGESSATAVTDLRYLLAELG